MKLGGFFWRGGEEIESDVGVCGSIKWIKVVFVSIIINCLTNNHRASSSHWLASIHLHLHLHLHQIHIRLCSATHRMNDVASAIIKLPSSVLHISALHQIKHSPLGSISAVAQEEQAHDSHHGSPGIRGRGYRCFELEPAVLGPGETWSQRYSSA